MPTFLACLAVRHGRAFLIAIACIAGLTVAAFHATSGQENALEDLRAAILRHPVSRQTVLVEIDDKSISRIGAWPWPRSIHAALLDRIRASQPKRVIFDLDFTSPSPDRQQDDAFAGALRRAGGSVVLPGTREAPFFKSAQIVSSAPIPVLAKNSSLASFDFNIIDGVIRQGNYGENVSGRFAPSIASYISDRRDLRTAGCFSLDWSIDPATVDRISYADVLQGFYDPSFFRGRVVMVGATAEVINGRFLSPVYGELPGALINLIAGETLRQGMPDPIGQFPMLGLALVIVAGACLSSSGALRIIIFTGGAVGIFTLSLWLRFLGPIVIESVAALVTMFAAIIAQSGLLIAAFFVSEGVTSNKASILSTRMAKRLA